MLSTNGWHRRAHRSAAGRRQQARRLGLGAPNRGGFATIGSNGRVRSLTTPSSVRSMQLLRNLRDHSTLTPAAPRSRTPWAGVVPVSLMGHDAGSLAFLTDLYQLTMAGRWRRVSCRMASMVGIDADRVPCKTSSRCGGDTCGLVTNG